MSKRLVKVAKELNVGVTTIVEFLSDNGFEIENKPTAKVTDEMESALLKEFQKDVAIKEKADQLIIGTRPSVKKDTPEKEERATVVLPPTPPSPPPAPPTPPVEKQVEEAPVQEAPKAPVPEPQPEQDPVPAPKAQPESEPVAEKSPVKEDEEKKPLVQLKFKGKIDLDADKKEKAAKPATPPVTETPVEKKPVEAKKPEVVEKPAAPQEATEKQPEPIAENQAPVASDVPEAQQPLATAAPKPGLIKAEAPELRGLKILGKINIEKDTKKKKKKDEKPAPGSGNAGGNAGDKGGDDKPKRKRKRRTVSSRPVSGNAPSSAPSDKRKSGGGSKRTQEERDTVSQKEIDDKIKATMARLSGGNKKKRQKLRRDNRERIREKQEIREQEQQTDKLQVTEFISVQDLASIMNLPVSDVIMACMNLGVIVSINQRLDAEIIELVTEEFGHEIEFVTVQEESDEAEEVVDDPADLIPRSPIVTVMGHVDHGKTSLLDFIRSAKVAEGEAGGITQHIGAYEVVVGPDDRKITFLDTPGHEAFTAMRARGAKITDIAVIIIAADDNIMPQTREAISHAQAANVPMVFAINKIDKDGAQPERIKQELASMNLLIEEWGGNYQSHDISAKTGDGVDLLLEKIIFAADLLELKANPNRAALGAVLEASLDKGRGYVTKALVQTGTLEVGDPIVAGEYSGKVRAMFNERGVRLKKAGPSVPVLVLGLNGAPQAGERFKEMDNEQEARHLASRRGQIAREQANRANKRISLDEIGRRLALGMFKELNLIVKGDVDGSIEALADSLIKLSVETIQVNVIHKAVGQIIESDVLLASASDAIIVGFQVRPSLGARKIAEREGVEIKTYSIIYEAIEEIRAAMEGMLEPTREERIVANLTVREIYKISKLGTIAGCYVEDGKILRQNHVRLIRDGIVVFPTKEGAKGEIASLRRFRDDVKEVKSGMECGVVIKNFNDIKVDDTIEAYEIIEVQQTLD
ncbi:MAG: translation initiation factor IF-2 [Saprospiraceae bacterium]|nr:translation initiation factor IF-2 [Saprospiraceae bacterium]